MNLVFNTRVFQLLLNAIERNTTLNWKIQHFSCGVVERICTRNCDEIAIFPSLIFLFESGLRKISCGKGALQG